MEILSKNLCNGCSACYNKCPVDAIMMEADEWGFLYPKVNESRCIHCNACKAVCPVINKKEVLRQKDEVYAIYSLDKQTRYNSTSGGVFSELANWILGQGGAVIGARYTKEHLVQHCMIESIEEISLLRQSKYIQSEKGDIYKQAKKVVENGRKLLFVGAPCEVNGLYNFLGKEYSNLYICDFICRGANAPNVYLKFLEELERKYNSKVKRVWFKNKEVSWDNFSTRVEFENGALYSETRDKDWFIRGYIEKCLYVRKSCTDCHFKSLNKVADLTLGDFWGVKEYFPEIDTQNGVSMVMVNSVKGTELLEGIKEKIFCEKSSFDEVIKYNGCLKQSVISSPETEIFLDKMNENGYEKAMEYFFHIDFLTRIRNKIERVRRKILRK